MTMEQGQRLKRLEKELATMERRMDAAADNWAQDREALTAAMAKAMRMLADYHRTLDALHLRIRELEKERDRVHA